MPDLNQQEQCGRLGICCCDVWKRKNSWISVFSCSIKGSIFKAGLRGRGPSLPRSNIDIPVDQNRPVNSNVQHSPERTYVKKMKDFVWTRGKKAEWLSTHPQGFLATMAGAATSFFPTAYYAISPTTTYLMRLRRGGSQLTSESRCEPGTQLQLSKWQLLMLLLLFSWRQQDGSQSNMTESRSRLCQFPQTWKGQIPSSQSTSTSMSGLFPLGPWTEGTGEMRWKD